MTDATAGARHRSRGLRDLSLRARLAWLFALVAVLLMAGSAVSVVAFSALLDARNDLVNKVDPGRLAAQQLLTAYLDQETAVRGYVLTFDRPFLTPYYLGVTQAKAAGAQLASVLATRPDLFVRAEAAEAAGRRWQDSFARPAIIATDAGRPTYASAPELLHSKALFDDFRVAMARLENSLTAARAVAIGNLNRNTDTLIGVLAATALLLVLAGLTTWRALRLWVTDPLERVGSDARRVADGELAHVIAPTGPPEFVRLAANAEAMRGRIVGELGTLEAARSELAQRNAELARSNIELEQFAYVASHDLQEPLRKVASFCQLVQQRYAGQLDARADQYLDYAVDGAKRMQGLINDLLEFSRVGRTTERFTPVDLAECVQDAFVRLASAISETGASLMVGPLPVVLGDRGLLATLLQNLIGNSLKFRSDVPPLVQIDAVDEGPTYLVTVADNGIGVEPRFAERVFVIFQRLHTREAFEGTGIGLALCRKIVEFHGGQIWIDTEREAGTRVCVRLPAMRGATAT